jgi:hypothetical protein
MVKETGVEADPEGSELAKGSLQRDSAVHYVTFIEALHE